MAKKNVNRKSKSTIKKMVSGDAVSKTTKRNKSVSSTNKISSKKNYQQRNVDVSIENQKDIYNSAEVPQSFDVDSSVGILPEEPDTNIDNLTTLAPQSNFNMDNDNTTTTVKTTDANDWNRVFTVLEQDLNENKQKVFVQRVYAPLNCSFKRLSEIQYELKGFHSDGVTPFTEPLTLSDKQEADLLWKELIEMEVNRSLTTDKQENKSSEVNSSIEVTNNDAKETAAPEKKRRGRPSKKDSSTTTKEMTKDSNDAKAITQEEIDPTITEIDIDAIVANPLGSTSAPVNMVNAQAKQEQSPEALSLRQLNDMENYGLTIYNAIMGSFRVRMHGGISMGEVQGILDGCLKEYMYKIENRDGGNYIVMQRGQTTVRIPREEDKFLPIV